MYSDFGKWARQTARPAPASKEGDKVSEQEPEGTGAERDPQSARARGIAKMVEVYGFSVDPDEIAGPYVDFTVDHLFGAIWTRPELEIRDRRLMTIGVLAALGKAPLLEIQFQSALDRGEMTEEQVRETVLHLTHYIGWPLSTEMNAVAEKVIARRNKGDDK
jgi:4-carboxymuconolactone decarboxylase